METVTDFIFLGSKISMDGDCCHDIFKKCLLLERKNVINPDSIIKRKIITWPTQESIVKVIVFPVVMYGYESWTIKKAECQKKKKDAFELWCWRRLFRVPWTTKRSTSQS